MRDKLETKSKTMTAHMAYMYMPTGCMH